MGWEAQFQKTYECLSTKSVVIKCVMKENEFDLNVVLADVRCSVQNNVGSSREVAICEVETNSIAFTLPFHRPRRGWWKACRNPNPVLACIVSFRLGITTDYPEQIKLYWIQYQFSQGQLQQLTITAMNIACKLRDAELYKKPS